MTQLKGLVALLFAAGCGGAYAETETDGELQTEPGATSASEEVCYPATYAEPCGSSAWSIETPGGVRQALVRGPGAPHRALSLRILRADNRYSICGRFAADPVADAECGQMPVFLASDFEIHAPIRRLHCGEGWGLFDDCTDAAGNAVYDEGPANLDPSDLELAPELRLECAGARCRTADRAVPGPAR